ncbi:unnamed protein product [Cylicocyclus nassatus]|uniref:SGNH domain-containing protein n=1 Tax=Cylicocyclus nassatus TaxID=53992 RepID=A0AA36GLL3_CYLNA|nr:unnamed protein product [Cylicocyclus nassatus]
MKEAEYHVYGMPCEKDKDTEIYTNYTAFPDYRCIAKGNGTASVILMGDSIACRAYALVHDIFKGRYRNLRLFSRPSCPFLWCSREMSEIIRKLVQREKPDVILYMQRTYFRFNAPIIELDTDFVYKQSQSNIEFIR